VPILSDDHFKLSCSSLARGNISGSEKAGSERYAMQMPERSSYNIQDARKLIEEQVFFYIP
jgi:hypothetical protein